MITKLFAIMFVLVAAGCGAGQHGLPVSEGITNFGKVDERLFRGAQPDAEGLKNLKRLGVKTIINFRLTNDVWAAEPLEAQAHGILYTNVPLDPLSRPTDEQVNRILSLIETSPAPVFIHCQFGRDRTGTIVSCYRIRHDHWSPQSALQEADHYGMSYFEYGMRRFVLDFARRSTGAP